MKFRSKYEYSNAPFGPQHVWTVVGRYGAIHLHVRDLGEEHGLKYGDRYSAGIEIHYRQPPDYMNLDAPSQDHCWLLKAPCWHDGSSLQASERWVPLWRAAPDDHEGMLKMLEQEMDERFNTGEEEE